MSRPNFPNRPADRKNVPALPRWDAVPATVRRLLPEIMGHRGTASFALIGGTAMSLQCGHRLSEDIDLACASPKLPRRDIGKLLGDLRAAGHGLVLATDENARLYWENEGADIDDHQQDWMVAVAGGDASRPVKLTFVADPELSPRKPSDIDGLRLMGLGELFEAKCRLLSRRQASRDTFDLWWFVTRGGRTVAELLDCVRHGNPYYDFDKVRARLMPVRYSPADPGFEALADDAPRDVETLRLAWDKVLGDYERALARKALAASLGAEGEGPVRFDPALSAAATRRRLEGKSDAGLLAALAATERALAEAEEGRTAGAKREARRLDAGIKALRRELTRRGLSAAPRKPSD